MSDRVDPYYMTDWTAAERRSRYEGVTCVKCRQQRWPFLPFTEDYTCFACREAARGS